MKNYLRKLTLGSIAMDVIFVLFGIFLIEKTGLSVNLISILLALIVILYSLMAIVRFISDASKIKYYKFELFLGIIGLILGVCIFANPFNLFNFFIIGFGIFMIVDGLNKLIYGLFYRKNKEEIWALNLGIGVIGVLLGIILIINPFSGVMVFTKALGIFVIANAVLDIMSRMLFYKRINAIVKLFNRE